MSRAFARCLAGLALLALSQCAQQRPELLGTSSRDREAGADVTDAAEGSSSSAAEGGMDAAVDAAAGGGRSEAGADAAAAGMSGAGAAAPAAGRIGAGAGAPAAGMSGAGAGGAGGAGGEAGRAGAAATPNPGCLSDIRGYDKPGPFEFTPESSGALKLWLPKLPAGCKVPVVHMANGTGATCENYRASLERLASHGFLSVCFENTNTGNGNAGLGAFETTRRLHPELADNKLGSAGHEQGGQGAIVTLQLAEAKWGDSMLYAGFAFAPSSGNGSHSNWRANFEQVKSPMLIASGTADALVSEAWVQQSFDALNDSVEAYLWSAVGATHIPVPHAAIDQVSVAWFRWKLLGDQQACEYFQKLPDGAAWDSRKQQNVRACTL